MQPSIAAEGWFSLSQIFPQGLKPSILIPLRGTAKAFAVMVWTGILSVSHPFRKKRGMDGAQKSIAKEEML
jgi:hypothetical protein